MESIAALKAVTGMSDGDIAQVTSYYTSVKPDGGGGSFKWAASSTDTADDGITVLPTGHSGAGRWKRIYSGAINVRWFGAKGNGATDDTTVIQAAIAAAPDGGTLFFPSGDYLVSSSISLASSITGESRGLHLFGDGNSDKTSPAPGQTGRSRILGSVNGPLIAAGGTTGSNPGGSLRKLFVENAHASGIGVRYQKFVGGVIEQCSVKAFRGIVARDSNFGFGIHDVVVRCLPGNPAGSMGIVSGGHTTLTNIDASGFETGLSLFGSCVSLSGLRAEVNVVGMTLGYDTIGAAGAILSRSSFSGLSFEANDFDIYIAGARSTSFNGVETQGSSNAPSGSSDYGLYIDGALQYVTFNSVYIGGTYSTAGTRTGGQAVEGTSFINCQLNSTSWHANTPSTKFTFIRTAPIGTAYPMETPAQITSNQAGYGSATTLYYSQTWRLSADAPRTIFGIYNVGGGARELRIVNVGSQAILLANQSGSEPTAANRIISGTGLDYLLAPDAVASLVYDSASARWRVTG